MRRAAYARRLSRSHSLLAILHSLFAPRIRYSLFIILYFQRGEPAHSGRYRSCPSSFAIRYSAFAISPLFPPRLRHANPRTLRKPGRYREFVWGRERRPLVAARQRSDDGGYVADRGEPGVC